MKSDFSKIENKKFRAGRYLRAGGRAGGDDHQLFFFSCVLRSINYASSISVYILANNAINMIKL